MVVLGRKDDGMAMLQAALTDLPLHIPAILTLTSLLLNKGDTDATMPFWQTAFDADRL
jgi:hypothetical protein